MFSIRPIFSTFNILTIFTHFKTSSCDTTFGVVTMITASVFGIVCKTVNGSSPVPGGLSMIKTSSGPHSTSAINCLMEPDF